MFDNVMVRPLRTYLEGSDLVSPKSAPYPVSRGRAIELRNNGLVTFQEPEPAPEAAGSLQGPAAEPATPKSTGRRSRAT